MARKRKRIRLAIIGCGGFVRSHIKAINDHVPEFEIVALVEPAAAHVDRFMETLGGETPPVFKKHTDMLKAAEPDAVIVSTPHTLHFRHAYDAISAGAHAMIEKPMVTNADDARKLVAHAKRKKRALQIAIQGTHTDTFAYARKLITDGTMGPLQMIAGLMAQNWMKGTTGMWRQVPRLSGGGQLYDSTAHVLSAMMFLVDSPVREVTCLIDKHGRKVDINAVGGIRFANGCLGTITSGGNCAPFQSMLTVQGAGAFMQISPHGGDFKVIRPGVDPITAVPKSWKIPTVTPARNFADVILGKAAPRCPGRLGVLLADLMDALYEAARTGKTVKVTRRVPKA